MSDPTGGSDLLARIVIERQGGELLKQTRSEIAGLRNDVQQPLNVPVDAAGPFKNLNRELEQGQGHLRHVRTALTGLAFEATGTAGPVGHLASSLLLFSGGSGLTLGVAAGIGLIAGAYRLATQTSRELVEQQDKLDKQYREILGHGAPNVVIMQKLTEAIDAQAAAYKRYETLLRGGALGKGRGTPGEVAEALGDLSSARNVTVALHQELADEHRKQIKEAGRRAAEDWSTGFTEHLGDAVTIGDFLRLRTQADKAPTHAAGRRAGEEWRRAFLEAINEGGFGRAPFTTVLPRGFDTSPFPSTLGGGAGPDPLGLRRPDPFALSTFQSAARRIGGQGMVDFQQVEHNRLLNEADTILERLNITHRTYDAEIRALDEAVQAGTISHQEYAVAVKDLTDQLGKAQQKSLDLAVSIVGAVSGAIAAIVSGGSPGGILSGVGGILGFVPGGKLAGAVFQGLGAIVSAGDRGSRGVRIDSYSQAAIEQMKQAAQTPQRYVFNIISPTTGQTIGQVVYETGRRAARDAIVRVPSQS